MPRPGDVAGDRGQVAHHGGRGLALLVLVLHLVQLEPVVAEDDGELGLELCAEALALQDALELIQQLQGPFDGSHRVERVLDKLPEAVLQVRDAVVELHVVAVEPVLLEIEHVVLLRLEREQDRLEILHQLLHAVEAMLGQRGELLNRLKHVDQLEHTPAEQVEPAENQCLAEVELLAVGKLLERLLRLLVLLLVRHVQLDARVEVVDQHLPVLVPQGIDVLALQHAGLARRDHLVCDFGEELRHALGGVIIS
mmetsp:Transcript_39932/g.120716  ORF Transcript_39932/g.120716 Transcript_39932/m.120716 type:complete len:253 (+) Transcript_39932:1126-1884(+)